MIVVWVIADLRTTVQKVVVYGLFLTVQFQFILEIVWATAFALVWSRDSSAAAFRMFVVGTSKIKYIQILQLRLVRVCGLYR